MLDFVNDLLTLKDTTATSYRIEGNKIFIYVESMTDKTPCRQCGKETELHGPAQEVKIRHLPILGKQCFLIIKPKRGKCKYCDDSPTTNQRLDWYEYKGRNTKDYENHLLYGLINSTISDVSIKEQIGYDAIDGIVDRRISDEVDWKRFKKLGLIGIDEIALRKGHNNYVTIITSRLNDKSDILAVLKGKEKADVEQFLRTIPSKLKATIKGVCCDMCDAYIGAAKSAFGPKVPIIADRFHVAKLYRKSLVQLRKKELVRLRKKLTAEQYKALAPAIAIMVKSKGYATTEERKILSKLFYYSPALKAAFNLCCKLTHIYNSHIGIRAAKRKINGWIEAVEASDLACFNTFVKTLTKYKTEIIAYFKGRHTSGFVEGLNNKIKVIKRRCYGVFDVNTLFRGLFLDLSGYDEVQCLSAMQPA